MESFFLLLLGYVGNKRMRALSAEEADDAHVQMQAFVNIHGG